MYSAKDIEELNAKNIEYPDGSMHTLYEAEQQQRAFERKIRTTKRTLAACDEALNNLSDEELLQKLENGFCKRTGLLPDGSRSQVYGFGKSTSQKAVWKNEKQKVYAAANSAIRNTGRVLEFNSKASFYKSSALNIPFS